MNSVFTFSPADGGAQRHDQEVDESMPHIGGTGVGQIGKVTQGDNIRRAIHDQLQPGLRLPNQRARDNGGYYHGNGESASAGQMRRPWFCPVGGTWKFEVIEIIC